MNMEWTKDNIEYLKANFAITKSKVLAHYFGCKTPVVTYMATKLGLKKNPEFLKTHCRYQAGCSPHHQRFFWTEKDDDYVRNHYENTRTEDIAKALGKSIRAVYQRAYGFGLKKSQEFLQSPACGIMVKGSQLGVKTRFKKGQEAWNKGLKGLKLSPGHTCFEKGHLPHNTKNDNDTSIRINKEGRSTMYIRVELGKWIPLQYYNWIKIYGPIPKKHVLACKNGDRLNCDPSNWELLTMTENMKRNQMWNWPEDLNEIIKINNKLKKQLDEKDNIK
jgi:hypothetical protein